MSTGGSGLPPMGSWESRPRLSQVVPVHSQDQDSEAQTPGDPGPRWTLPALPVPAGQRTRLPPLKRVETTPSTPSGQSRSPLSITSVIGACLCTCIVTSPASQGIINPLKATIGASFTLILPSDCRLECIVNVIHLFHLPSSHRVLYFHVVCDCLRYTVVVVLGCDPMHPLPLHRYCNHWCFLLVTQTLAQQMPW